MEYTCSDCPRSCAAQRTDHSGSGFCNCPTLPLVARASPHFGEEPCISGQNGAGTVFFSGCNLRCVFCQNREISRSLAGKQLSVPALQTLMLHLRDRGVHNIDLVTPTHYTRVIAEALNGISLGIPVVWNSSGYESPESLRMLDGLVQVYMPDFKFYNTKTADRYCSAADYPQVVQSALLEMYRQRGPVRFDSNGLLLSGLLIRHLILPGHAEEARNIIDFVADSFPPGSVVFSLMSQYTPILGLSAFPELSRPVSSEENDALIHYMKARHIRFGYWQELSSAGEESIPDFDGTGLDFL